jgi:hypothetical protein
MTMLTRYRIKLAGAFPHVTPRHVDKDFASPRDVIRWAITECINSIPRDVTQPGYTRFTICKILSDGSEGPTLLNWEAGV